MGKPVGGGPPPTSTPSKDDEDAGEPLVAAMLACDNVKATPFVGEDVDSLELVNATELPSDFAVTRVAVGPGSDCDASSVVLVQSGGRCPDGNGHELVFTFDAESVTGGRFLGQYVLGSDEPPPVQIRYTRPENARPSGTWGTCGAATGTIEFVGTPGTARRDRFEARYELALTACDDGAVGVVQNLYGTFAAELEQGVDDVCSTP